MWISFHHFQALRIHHYSLTAHNHFHFEFSLTEIIVFILHCSASRWCGTHPNKTYHFRFFLIVHPGKRQRRFCPHHKGIYMGRRGKAPLILNLSTTWKWVFSFTNQLFYPKEKSSCYSLITRLSGPQSWSGHLVKKKISRPCWKSNLIQPTA